MNAHVISYFLQYSRKIAYHFVIPKMQNLQPKFIEYIITQRVIFFLLYMDPTIRFNNQASLMTEKINDIS